MDFKLFKIVKLNFLLNVLITIGIICSSSKKTFVSMKTIKWYAYCHFKGDSYDVLSCGKCFYPYESNKLENDEEVNLVFFDNLNLNKNSSNNMTSLINVTNFTTESKSLYNIFNATTNRNLIEAKPKLFNSSTNNSNRFCDLYEENAHKNHHYHHTIFNDIEQESFPLLPILTQNWFNFDLLYLIEKNEILSNLNNYTAYSKLSDNMRVIELTNFGIETIGRNAFKQFKNLQVLKLNNNKISTIELSSFLFDDPTELNNNNNDLYSYTNNSRSQIVELDLSFNRLSNIKLENFLYLESLKVLNFSHNFLKKFDLHFLSIVAPQLQLLDVSFNYLKNFKIIDYEIYFAETAMSDKEKSQKLSLVTNQILKNLTYLNLHGNYLHDFNDLFSFNFEHLQDKRFCNMTMFNLQSKYSPGRSEITNKLNSNNLSINKPMKINLENNAWECNCKTFEFINSILAQINSSNLINEDDTRLFKNSCYFNYFLKQNDLIFTNKNFNSTEMINIKCLSKNNDILSKNTSINWFDWYNQNCSKHNSSSLLKVTTTVVNSTKSTIISFSSTITSSGFNFDWLSTFYNSNTTRMTNVLKYDVSSAFYWVSSICIAVITISCLFVAWFYCWKRYSISRRFSTIRTNRRNNLSANGVGNRREGASCPQRRNFFNTRFNNSAFANSETNERIAQFMNPNPDSAHQGLYYIYRGSTEANFESSNGFNMNNITYINQNREDEPPNYYEAILIKNRIPNQHGKTSRETSVITHNIDIAARTSLNNDNEISQINSAENSDRLSNETIISSNFDEMGLAQHTEANISISNSSIHLNSTNPSIQMTAYINISGSSDDSINSTGQSSDV